MPSNDEGARPRPRKAATSRRSGAAAPKRTRKAPVKAEAPAEETEALTQTAATAAPEAPPPAAAEAPPDPADDDDDLDAANDFVTFALRDEVLAFPMDRVQEIIRMPETVAVPFAPPSLLGLANLRGRVLPVVSLRRCCAWEEAEADEATRVIVVDAGTTLGFVVDRVAAVVAVPDEQIDTAEGLSSTVASELVSSVIRSTEGSAMAVLDVGRIVEREFRAIAGHLAGAGAAQAAGALREDAGGAADGDEDDDEDTVEMVSFVVDEQEYAVGIDEIQEIVQAAEAVSTIPNADHRVVGVMDLRGRLLPLVSLRTVFGLPARPLEESSRIVVMPLLSDDGTRHAVGVVVDAVREVLRVPRELVDGLPGFVGPEGARIEVESVCRLDGGARLVSVVSAATLFGDRGLRAALDGQRDPSSEAATDDGAEEEDDSDDQLVVFRIDGEEFCLSVDAVQEIIRVPDELIEVPRAPEFVEGLVNLRGSVLPVVDLRSRLGVGRSDRDDLQRIVVVIMDGRRTGFIVDSVAEVMKLPEGMLGESPALSAEQAELIDAVANLTDSGRMLQVLDPGRLLGGDDVAAWAEEATAA